MHDASQFTMALRIGLAGLRHRLGAALVIVASVACTIGVLVSILALATGLRRAYTSGVSDAVAVVLAGDAALESRSMLSGPQMLTVLDAPGIARGTVQGSERLLASAEFRAQLPAVPRAADGSIQVRGVQPTGLSPAIRPEFRIIAGRSFRPGAQELIIGAKVASRHGARIGGSILMPDGYWPVVGTFVDGGSITEGELMGDADTVRATMKRASYSRMLVALESPAHFEQFSAWVSSNQSLNVLVERQSDYQRRIGGEEARYFTAIAWSVGLVMALGALFACVKILYANVSARAREMATLRAMGYGRLPVAASVLSEGILLAVLGALLGGCAAWLLFDGRQAADYNRMFTMVVTPGLLMAGVGWAVILATVGGAIPAWRAAQLQVVEVLRET